MVTSCSSVAPCEPFELGGAARPGQQKRRASGRRATIVNEPHCEDSWDAEGQSWRMEGVFALPQMPRR